jgi:tRNA (guanine26-N2/guanine27-N2)-dimethyltransferase
VIANDLSPEAVVAMKRNVDLNGLGPAPVSAPAPATEGDMQVDSGPAAPVQLTKKEEEAAKGKVRVNEGDAWYAFCLGNVKNGHS